MQGAEEARGQLPAQMTKGVIVNMQQSTCATYPKK